MTECKHFIRHYDCDSCTAVASRMNRAEYLRNCNCNGYSEHCDFLKTDCKQVMNDAKART